MKRKLIQQNNYKKIYIDYDIYDDVNCNRCTTYGIYQRKHIDYTGHIICYKCKCEIIDYNTTIQNNNKSFLCYLLCYFKSKIINNNDGKNISYFFGELCGYIILKYMRIISNQINEITNSVYYNLPNIFMKFKNPNEYVKEYATNINGKCIEYIENPSKKVMLNAVTQNEYTIKFIKNPSEELQLSAVKVIPHIIRSIKNPSEEVQLIAVKKFPFLIRHIKNSSKKVRMVALKNNEVY